MSLDLQVLSLIFAVHTLSFLSSSAFRDMKAVDSAPYLFIVSETQSLSEAVTKSPQLVVISRLVIHQLVTVKLVTVKATLIHALIIHQFKIGISVVE